MLNGDRTRTIVQLTLGAGKVVRDNRVGERHDRAGIVDPATSVTGAVSGDGHVRQLCGGDNALIVDTTALAQAAIATDQHIRKVGATTPIVDPTTTNLSPIGLNNYIDEDGTAIDIGQSGTIIGRTVAGNRQIF